MLYIPMYHYATDRKRGNGRDALKRHFEYYAENFHSVLPTDGLSDERPNICITFDDGYKDFGDVALPLLKEFDLKVILAISPRLTEENKNGEYLSYKELSTLLGYKNLEIASHGMSHTPILESGHAAIEAKESKRAIVDNLAVNPRCFVYPYGKFTVEAHREIKKEFDFVFRIGGAANIGWGQEMLYRFSADNVENPEGMFGVYKKINYGLKLALNMVRGL